MAPTPVRRITLLDGERSSLWYYPDKKIIHHQFRAFVHGEQFRGVLEKGLEAFRDHGAVKWLSDDRGNSATTEEDGDWAANTWAPSVIAAGWKYWGVVMPDMAVGKMSLRRFLKTYADRGVTVQVFSSPEDALEWLSQR